MVEAPGGFHHRTWRSRSRIFRPATILLPLCFRFSHFCSQFPTSSLLPLFFSYLLSGVLHWPQIVILRSTQILVLWENPAVSILFFCAMGTHLRLAGRGLLSRHSLDIWRISTRVTLGPPLPSALMELRFSFSNGARSQLYKKRLETVPSDESRAPLRFSNLLRKPAADGSK